MYNEAKRKSNDRYDRKNMIAYTIKYRKSIYAQVEKAMVDSGMNRNKWTTTAIVEKLKRDGYMPDGDEVKNEDNS